MSDKDTGGPAFPCVENMRMDSGMSLRDYIAVRAMQARLTDYQSMQSLVHSSDVLGKNALEVVAEMSYNMADAMLKARNK